MKADERIATRSSAALRNIVLGYGQLSTATRALVIIGAIELGTPASALEAEILDLDLSTLQPAVRTRLLAVLHSGATRGVQTSLTVVVPPVENPARDSGDPFDIGFSV